MLTNPFAPIIAFTILSMIVAYIWETTPGRHPAGPIMFMAGSGIITITTVVILLLAGARP